MIKYINSLDSGGQLETDYILAKKINEIIHYINDNEIKSKNYITKDKIRNEIKKLEQMSLEDDTFGKMRDYAILILKELLEEE